MTSLTGVRIRGAASITAGMLASLPAHANIVWPALYLETRLLAWWAIVLGLAIEFLFIRKVFALPAGKALVATVAANAASVLLGVLLIPLAGVAWEISAGLALYYLLGMGTFNPISWGASFVFACLINAGLEGYALKRFFRLPLTQRTFAWIVAANLLSVGVAFASLSWYPVAL